MSFLESTSSKLEDFINSVATPLRPFVPGIARFLLVVTFLEDSLRIVSQWWAQTTYLHQVRHLPWFFAQVFLVLVVAAMTIGSYLAITKKHTGWAVSGLFSVVVLQTVVYGYAFDFNFIVRSFSILGALLLLLADGLQNSRRRYSLTGLPSLSETDRTMYIQLAGRILLVFLFLSFAFTGEVSFLRLLGAGLGLIACVMVAIGFKAKWTAVFMVLFLSVFNVFINSWWTVTSPAHRDFKRYDFFQVLSIMGGFLLLANMGPGGISVDEKKKSY